MWNTGLIVFFGIWLLLAPFLVPDGAPQTWNALIVGVGVLLLGAVVPRAYSWDVFAAAVTGAWLCISAFASPTPGDGIPTWNSPLAGVLLIVTGARATAKTRTQAGPQLPL